VRVDPGEAALVAQIFDWYLEPQGTIYRLARRLTDLGVPTPRGGPRWNTASVRGILRNPAYAGRALSNRTQVAPARRRKSAMLPAGPGLSHAPRPEEDWITVPVPPIVCEEAFAQVQAKLDANQQTAARNTRHQYLLRALTSCGACRLTCGVRQTRPATATTSAADAPTRCAPPRASAARHYIPAGQLDELVWADLCALVTDPAQVARALDRARGGAWLPQELHARQMAIRQALGQLDRQQQRLLDAYLAEIIALAEFQRKRDELDRRRAAWRPSSARWTPPPPSGWNCRPSPTASRHSARPSAPGWPPPPSSSAGCWLNCSSTGWSSPTARSRSATCSPRPPTGRTALLPVV
jgi:site-specific DNA recombinase